MADAMSLSTYDEARTPHTTITDDVMVQLPVRSLDTEILCPICLAPCRNTMTTMECLHRFCSDCISKSLRFSNKECPTCRHVCPTMRSLRPDPEFDAIVAQVYPDLDEFDLSQVKTMETMAKYSNTSAYAVSVQEGMRRQALSRRGSGHSGTKEKKATRKQRTPVAVKRKATVLLKPHTDNDPHLAHRYVLPPPGCLVAHIEKYVSDRLRQPTEAHLHTDSSRVMAAPIALYDCGQQLKPGTLVAEIVTHGVRVWTYGRVRL
eukprot:m.562951 g.562951  ORF g.562951 m.562951 type:complete len:262 (+) comp22228_c1_seq1:76-861(+)